MNSKNRDEAELPAFVDTPCWKVSPPLDFSEFLRQLPRLLPPDSILYAAGTPVHEVEAYLLARPSVYENRLSTGVFGLRAKGFYMPATEANLRGFADIAENFAEPEVCDHLHVYRNNQAILHWYDLPADHFYVSTTTDENSLRDVCQTLGCHYELETESC
ncbi:MAG TPA: hypothetical protein VF666_01240 [Pyrinomonadaceae bacterium]|jgi:hypothetical protein